MSGHLEKGHLQHVQDWWPRILEDKILDVGSGRGKFLIEVAGAGGSGIGVERSEIFIEMAHARAAQEGVKIRVLRGVGEKLPFPDKAFGFVNMSELIEHVQDPLQVLREVRRVLKNDGAVYMSVPNRFALKDPHFHTYFVNWLPRSFSGTFLRMFGIRKDLRSELDNGYQRLDEMHYYTLRGITKACQSVGFQVIDNREEKINRMKIGALKKALLLAAYTLARLFYFDTFHLKLVKILN